MMQNEKPYFIMYYDYIEIIRDYSHEQKGILLDAIAAYAQYGEILDTADPFIDVAFKVGKNKIDLSRATQDLTSEQNRLRGYLNHYKNPKTQKLIKYLLEESKTYKNVKQFKKDHTDDYRQLNELREQEKQLNSYEPPELDGFEPDYIPPEINNDYFVPSDKDMEEVLRETFPQY